MSAVQDSRRNERCTIQHGRGVKALTMVVATIGAVAATARATDYTWNQRCTTNGWTSTCNNGEPCGTGNAYTIIYNNWGLSQCSEAGPLPYPGAGDNAYIGGDASVGTQSVFDLSVSGSGQLTINGGVYFDLMGPALANSGLITMAGSASAPVLHLHAAETTLSGGGTVALASPNDAGIRGESGTERLINADNTIQGRGTIAGNAMSLTNRGVIDANISGQTIQIDPNSTGAVNSGTMQATGGGRLWLQSGTFTNFEGATNGWIHANASTVQINNATVTGGNLDVVGNGQIQLYNSGVIAAATVANSTAGTIRATGTSNVIGGFTNPAGGQVILDNNAYLTLTGGGTFSNDGSMTMNPTSSYVYLYVGPGDVTLSGAGTLTLSGPNPYSYVQGKSATDRLINTGNTIQGTGYIGNNAMALTNQGVIDANVSGQTLTVRPSSSGAINSGTMRATSGGQLILQYGTFTNSDGGQNGLIRANASMVQITAATVTGGNVDVVDNGQIQLNNNGVIAATTVANSSTGTIRAMAGSTNAIGGFTNPAGGQVIVENAGYLTLTGGGTFTNDGSITMNGTPSNAYLYVGPSDVTLSGGGTLTLNGQWNYIKGKSAADRLINAGNAIRGTGYLGDGAMALTNQGVIDANVSGTTLTVRPSGSGAINSGTMQATSGGQLILQYGTFTNSEGGENGLIRADASTVQINSATVTGGNLDVVGGGQIQLGGSAVVAAATVANSTTGTIRATGSGNVIGGFTNPAGGQVILDNAAYLTLTGGGTFTNDGGMTMNGTTSYSDLFVGPGDVTLSGAGTLTLNGQYNYIMGKSATDRLINAGNAIRGTGYLGNGQMALTNRGLIDANVSGTTLEVRPSSSGAVNSGTMRASGGGQLTLQTGPFTNFEGGQNGTIRADGSTVRINSATVTGGNLDVVGGGQIQLGGSAVVAAATVANSTTGTIRATGAWNVIGGFTNPAGGQVIMDNAAYLTLTGGGTFTNDGSITMNGTSSYDNLYVGPGDVTLSGAGTLTLNGQYNYIMGKSATDRLINAGNTIRGTGYLGNTVMALTNRGLIDANVSGTTLTVQTSGSGAINSGTMQASGGGELKLQTGPFTNFEGEQNGLIRADGSTVQINNATITGGNLDAVNGGQIQLLGSSPTITDAALTIGTGSLLAATGGTSTLSGATACTNNGTIRATGGGVTLNVNRNVNGAGGWTADAATIKLNSGVNALTTGPIAITNNGTIQLTNANLTGSRLAMDGTGRLTVAGSITLSGDLTFAMTGESYWSWAAGATLTLAGGTGGPKPVNWTKLEAGGADNGPATGYSNNFDLSVLTIGDDAFVALVDYENNGNRVSDKREAVYADSLTVGAGATLNLNGLRLYVGGAQIAPGPCGGGQIIDSALVSVADCDADGDVDLTDFGHFQSCFNGPNRPPARSGCQDVDFDVDIDVDLTDFGVFQACFNGPNRPPACS